MVSALKKVFGRATYVAFAILVAGIVFSVLTLLPNVELVVRVVTSPAATFTDILKITTGLLTSLTATSSVLSIFYISTISLLFGVNVAVVTYYFRRAKKLPGSKETLAGAGGLVGGVLGAGCIACGSVVLSPLFSLLGAGAITSFLPFGGSEFGILGIGALVFSISITSKKIQRENTPQGYCNLP